MSDLKVLRPIGVRGRPYRWVHIDADGKPLCGQEATEFAPSFRSEVWDMSEMVCQSCRTVEHQFSVSTIQAGQVRKYGPSEYVYDVTDLADKKRGRAEVLEFCQENVHTSYAKSNMPNPFSPRLQELSERTPGVWRYHVFCESTH